MQNFMSVHDTDTINPLFTGKIRSIVLCGQTFSIGFFGAPPKSRRNRISKVSRKSRDTRRYLPRLHRVRFPYQRSHSHHVIFLRNFIFRPSDVHHKARPSLSPDIPHHSRFVSFFLWRVCLRFLVPHNPAKSLNLAPPHRIKFGCFYFINPPPFLLPCRFHYLVDAYLIVFPVLYSKNNLKGNRKII